MRVGEQIAEVLRWHDRKQDAGGGHRVAELFGLGLPEPERMGRYPHQLSGGQQQRVTIAMALACAPDLLVLDEPTTGLDVTTQEQIIELLADLRARLGMSMLYVTHDLGVLAEIADRRGTPGIWSRSRPPRCCFRAAASVHARAQRSSRAWTPLRERSAQPCAACACEIPPGCPFYPRCDFAEPSCATNAQRSDVIAPHASPASDGRDWPAGAGRRADEAARPRPLAPAPLLELEDISLSYGGRSPAADVRARKWSEACPLGRARRDVRAGRRRAAASTLARAISGVLAPAHGQIRFAGRPLPPATVRARSDAVRQQIQYIFQNPDASLNPRRTVGDTVGRLARGLFQMRRPKRRSGSRRCLRTCAWMRATPSAT